MYVKPGEEYPLNTAHRAELETKGVTVGKVINSGRYGHVCEATMDIKDIQKMKIAVKIVELESTSEKYVKHFLPKELKAMESLEHPFIVAIHRIWVKDKTVYVFMEKALGGDLIDMLEEQQNGIAEDRAKQLYRGIVSALQYIHNKGFAHRDIKCENVLLMDEERKTAKLTDFGFSTFGLVTTTGQRVLSNTNCGTPYYSPPEIYKKQPYDATKMDIFSLGVVLFTMINNEMPFTDTSIMNAAKDANQSLEYSFQKNDMSKDLTDLVKRQLQVDPNQRPTISEVANHNWLH